MFYPPKPDRIKAAMRAKGYLVFGDPRGYDLNLFGIRTRDVEANTFDDWLGVMYLVGEAWRCFVFPGTTDPGTYWRLHPMNTKGTAILKPGQYRGAFELGTHKGYEALTQKAPMVVYRDGDRDNVLEVDEANTDEGIFGINLHRASAVGPSVDVDKWSAGCQVIQDPIHFAFLVNLAKASAGIFGNSFTYTLLTDQDLS